MGTLTRSQVQSLATAQIKVVDQLKKFASGSASPSSNLVALIDAVTSALNAGDYADQVRAGAQNVRAAVATALTQIQGALEPIWVTYAQTIAVPETDASSVISRVYRDMVAQTQAVTSRCLVFGSASAGGSNVGSGNVYRVTTDADGFAIEAGHAEAKTLECVADANSGAVTFGEVFSGYGTAQGRDAIAPGGSGSRNDAITAMSGRTSKLSNTSFSVISGGTDGAPTGLTSWTYSGTLSSEGSVVRTSGGGVNAYYRTFFGDMTPGFLRLTANTWTLSQDLTSLRKQFRRYVPVFVGIRVRRKSSADGTLTVTFGGSSVAVDLTSYSNDAWNNLVISPGTGSWLDNFDNSGSALTFSIARSGGTTGTVDIDDCQIEEFAFWDGAWVAVWGSSTAYVVGDTYTFTDTENASPAAVVQNAVFLGYGRYLPARPASPTTPVAVALAGAGAGNVENGAHGYKVTFVHSSAGESGGSSAASVTVVDKTTDGEVAVSSIPLGPTGTTSRKLYRTVAAGSTYKLLTTIADNVTTTYTDNTADASLGATIPDGVTWADS